MSNGFFRYYWRAQPNHPYDVTALPFYPPTLIADAKQEVVSHDHLRWGLYRLYVDGLLYFGNITAAYSALRSRTFGLRQHGGGAITFKQLLQGVSQSSNRDQLLLSFDDVLDANLASEDDLNHRFDEQFERFYSARQMATRNTALYLSMVNDLDVYVATSMRNRQNFRDMATTCERIFGDARLERFHLRYFDPTMSAARGHEDKGLIECLMVKCAKVVIYTEGEKESYGKDAEAAMVRDSPSRLTASYLKLHEKLTDSVVRLQTDDELLTATFWNNYHNRQTRKYVTLASGKEAERLQE